MKQSAAKVEVKGFNQEIAAAAAAGKKITGKKAGSGQVSKSAKPVPSIEEREEWTDEVYGRVVARLLCPEDLDTWNEKGYVFFKEKVQIILAGREVPSVIYKRYICAVEAQLKVLQEKAEREAAIATERKKVAAEEARKHAAEQKKKEETAKAKPSSPVQEKVSPTQELRKKLLAAEKKPMDPRGYALVLDGMINSPKEAMVLDAGARFVLKGKVYIIDDKTGRKIFKIFVGAKFKEANSSVSTSPVAVQSGVKKLPEKLDRVYVTYESVHGNRTYLVALIPEDFSPAEAQGRFKPNQLFAKRIGDVYKVWRRAKVTSNMVGTCRKASAEEKSVKKQELAKVSSVPAPKKPVKTVDRMAGDLQFALQAAMERKQVAVTA